MTQLRILITALLFGVLAVDIGLIFLPIPSMIADPGTFRTQLIVISSFSVNYFAAGILFLYGIRGFKSEMRRSYLVIAASMAFFGLANLQYPIGLFGGFIPDPWVTHGGSLLAVVPGLILFYQGIRQFARTLGIQSPLASHLRALATTTTLTALALLVPHAPEMPEQWYAVHTVGAVINLVYNGFAAGLIIQALRASGPSYKPALRYLTAGAGLSAAGFAHVLVAAFFGQNNLYTQAGVTAVPFILAAFLYIIAGYQFCKVRFDSQLTPHHTAPSRSVLDAVLMLESLVSNRNDIEPLIQEVRTITARLQGRRSIVITDQQRLIEIYYQLEDYLVHRERLRNFSRVDLRARLTDEALTVLPIK